MFTETDRACSTRGREEICVHKALVVKTGGKILLGRPRRRWKDNIKMFIWIRIGTTGGSCEHINEPTGFINCWDFLEQLSNYYILKKDSFSWSQ
jgi:hypothetical protein